MTIRIRAAVANDAALLAAFAERVFTRTFAPLNTPEDLAMYLPTAFGEHIQRRELEDPARVCLLAYVDDALSAFALLKVGSTDAAVFSDAPIEVERFYVDHAFHGLGLAAQLMAASVDMARERGGQTLWLGAWEKNPRAIRFYEKQGFVDVGSHPFVVGTDVQTDRVMARVLSADSGANAKAV